MLVSVNDTAATDSYTYLLTRSLHDALPISAVAQVGLGALDHRQAPIFRVRRNQDRFISREQIGALIVQVLVCQDIIIERSEEHTSELQSLMRISYAVFCLKKKKPLPTTDNPTYKDTSHKT